MDTEVAKVREEIIAAFSGLSIPMSRNLIQKPSTGDVDSEERLRRELSGKTWDSLSVEFLSKWWSSFCYLSAEAYRYYLPALLVPSLDNLSEKHSIVHTAVYSLVPSAWSLYYEGIDVGFRYRTSLFTPSQYASVCAFLGIFLSPQPEIKDQYTYQFLAARALRWGWNKHDTDAHGKLRRFDEEMHNFAYPNNPDPVKEALIEKIRTAFDETPYPGDNALCGSEQGDEPAGIALEFRGLDWRTLHPDFLLTNYGAGSFLSPEGFRYFLPAFLISELHGYTSNSSPVFSLTHGFYKEDLAENERLQQSMLEGPIFERVKELLKDVLPDFDKKRYSENLKSIDSEGVDWYEYSKGKFLGYNRDERLAIISFLEHTAISDEYEHDRIIEALDTYWRPSVA